MEEKNNNFDQPAEPVAESAEAVDPAVVSTAEEITSPSQESAPAVPDCPPQPPQKVIYAYRWDYTSQYKHDTEEKKHSGSKGMLTFIIIMATFLTVAIGAMFGALLIPSSSSDNSNLADLYEACAPSYVAISTVSELGTSGAGAGIVLTENGFIATNYHVVEGVDKINVILNNGKTVPAQYIDGDDLNDIAVLKIEETGLTPAKIGNSKNTRVGDRVMAIGTPFSIQYRGTMTSGYISALNRQYASKNENGTVNKVITLLQTDTSVNPGNSGGPLFNMKGEVIGIVTMKISSGGLFEGMGFAIPIEGVIDMLYDIVENGKLTIPNGGSAFEGAALGVSGFAVTKDTEYLLSGNYHYTVVTDENGNKVANYITSMGTILQIPLDDADILERYDIKDYTLYTARASGVLILQTTEGFDSAKKLRKDDIIVTANGTACDYMETLQEIIARSRVGDKIEFEVFRDNKTITVTVELGRSAGME